MIDKSASVQGECPGRAGRGRISSASGALARHPDGFASRFGDDRHGTNPEGDGFVIDRISLSPKADMPGIDQTRFPATARSAQREGPLFRALAAVAEIGLQATRAAATP